jgi:hypothetical protein
MNLLVRDERIKTIERRDKTRMEHRDEERLLLRIEKMMNGLSFMMDVSSFISKAASPFLNFTGKRETKGE